jgi:hypothetical protein
MVFVIQRQCNMKACANTATVASTGSWTTIVADVTVGSVLVVVAVLVVAVVAFCIDTVAPTVAPSTKVVVVVGYVVWRRTA